MSDIRITLDEANAWIDKVEREMEAVDILLKKVNTCVEDYKDKDDTVYQEIEKAGKSFKSAWDNLGKGYRDVFEGLRSVFRSQAEAVQQAVEMVQRENQKAKS